MRWRAAILSFLLVFSAGCGYKAVGYGSGFDGIRTISIQTPSNETYFPNVEYVVADALRREFLRRGAVRITEDPATADLVLAGSVRKLRTSARSFSSVSFALEYEVLMVLELEARAADGSIRPLSSKSLREVEFYLSTADVEATRKNRDEAIRRVAGLLAQRVHDNLFEAVAR